MKRKQYEAEGTPSLETKVSEAVAGDISERMKKIADIVGEEDFEEKPTSRIFKTIDEVNERYSEKDSKKMQEGINHDLDWDSVAGEKKDMDLTLTEAFIQQEAAAKRDKVAPIKIKALLTNSTLTVYLPSGDIISNTDANKELYFKVIAAGSEDEIRELMIPQDIEKSNVKEIKEAIEERKFTEGMRDIEETGEFEIKEGETYMRGIEIPIPKLLGRKLIEAGKTQDERLYNSLKNFWMWSALNPDRVAREALFAFLERGDFKITAGGMFLAYRNVDEVKKAGKSKDKALITFISSAYLNIKTKQKKSPKGYEVLADGVDYKVAKIGSGGKVIGNLFDLYNSMATIEENEFTDRHTHTFKILIGTEVSMPREKCDSDPSSDCSSGLHVGNKSFGFSSFGSTHIVVAVNPMNVIAVPTYNRDKMRVCAYMPLAIVEKRFLDDADTLELEEEYFGDQLEGLVAKIKEIKPTQSSKAQEVTTLDTTSYTFITSSLEGAKEVLAKRVVAVK